MNGKHVMIVDDDPALVSALVTRCEQAGLRTTGLSDGADAVAAIARLEPDLVILDINMPGRDGVWVCNALAANPQLAPIPVVILSGRDDEETIDRCRELGAHYLLKGGDVWFFLEPLIERLLDLAPPYAIDSAAHEPHEPTALVIDDDRDLCRAIQLRLSARGVRVISAQTGMKGYWMALRDRPHVVICDYTMPEGRGDYVIRRLREHSLTRDIPVFVLTGWRREGSKDFGLEREMFGLGAKRFFMKPLDLDALFDEVCVHFPLSDARPLTANRRPVLAR